MMRASVVVAVAAGVSALPAGGQALRAVSAVSLPPIAVPTNQGVQAFVEFILDGSPIVGFGLTGTYVTQQGDFVDGLGPWSLDVRVTAFAPGGEQLSWNPIGGDVTIADYPFSDGVGGLGGPGGVDGEGEWTFLFDSVEPVSNWIYRIDDPVLYVFADAPPVTFAYTAEPDPATSWDRPFFIQGVSGLGPVSFDALAFEVSVTGVYELTSVLSTGEDHFTFLYQGDAGSSGFDPAQPLENLLDYGLGNGNSPFGVPEGTSRVSALLMAGERYTWVTSQWSRFDAIAPASNTIVGPGVVTEVSGACPADVNGDGELNDSDFFAWVTAFTADPRTPAQEAACDVNEDGSCTDSDFFAWVTFFTGEGCP